MKEKIDSFFRRTLHSFLRKAPYRKTMKTVQALFFSFMLSNLIKNGTLDFLLATLAYMHFSL